MNTIVTHNVWREIKKHAVNAPTRRCAVAYVTDDTHFGFKAGDELICDASDYAIKCRETSAKLLSKLHKLGVKIYSVQNLHAKMMVLGDVGIIGSANMSGRSGDNQLVEAILITSRNTIVSQITSSFELLKSKADHLGKADIARLRGIKLLRRPVPPPLRQQVRVVNPKQGAWFVTAREIEENEYPAEAASIKSGMDQALRKRHNGKNEVTWLRWNRTDKFGNEVRPGELVVQAVTRGNKIIVYRPAIVLRRQVEKKCVRIYVEESFRGERSILAWKNFQALMKHVGAPVQLKRTSQRRIPLEMVDDLQKHWNKFVP